MNNQEKLFKVGSLVGIFLIIFLGLLSLKELLSLQYVGKDVVMVNTIIVKGNGEAVSIPDIATFSFSVTENGKTVKDAQDKANGKTSAALKAIKAGGVAQKDIKTISYNINPHYEYTQTQCTTTFCPAGKSVLTGYDVSQTIQVKVRDLAKAGELFDSIGSVGVQNVDSLAFSIDDIDSVKEIARTEAIADAKIKAQKLADNLGVRIVKITNFYDASDDQPVAYDRNMLMSEGAMSAKAMVATELPKGEQKVTASVLITYEIK